MSEYSQINTDNEFFEALLERAVRQNLLGEIAAVPPREELERLYVFSEEHNGKMKKLFSADSRREVIYSILKWTKVAVIIVCVSATLLFGTLMASAEFREAVSNVIITWYEQFTKFQSPELGDSFEQRDWSPEYMPEGFTLSESYGLNTIKGMLYSNGSGAFIEFQYMPGDASISVDNEDKVYSTIIDNDITYHIFSTTDVRKGNSIVWDMSGHRFAVIGNYETDELLKIALSVR